MNAKFLSIISLFLLLSCNQTGKENPVVPEISEINDKELTESDISKLGFRDFGLDSKTEKIIEDWQEYYQIQDVVNNVKKGYLSFFKNDEKTIKTLLKDLRKNIPLLVNTPATKARIQVLETKLYKLKSTCNLNTTSKTELASVIKEFLTSFSNLNFQMNKKLEKDANTIKKP